MRRPLISVLFFTAFISSTYDGKTVYRKLVIIRQMAYDVCGEMMTCKAASEIQMHGGEPRPTYVAFAPLLAAQERPNIVVVAPVNPDRLEVDLDLVGELRLLNEEDCTL